jgi:predicted phosphoribosyltransferase
VPLWLLSPAASNFADARTLRIDVHQSAIDATGATMEAALPVTRRADPQRLVLATPVAPPDTLERLRPQVDEVVCLATPRLFAAIGAFYEDFRQLSDDEVIDLLRRAPRADQEPTATAS